MNGWPRQPRSRSMSEIIDEVKAGEARLAESIEQMKAKLQEPDPIKAIFGVSQSTLIQINNGEFDV